MGKKQKPPDSLVYAGGGAKGLAYCGVQRAALAAPDDDNSLWDADIFAGASIGSLFATLACIYGSPRALLRRPDRLAHYDRLITDPIFTNEIPKLITSRNEGSLAKTYGLPKIEGWSSPTVGTSLGVYSRITGAPSSSLYTPFKSIEIHPDFNIVEKKARNSPGQLRVNRPLSKSLKDIAGSKLTDYAGYKALEGDMEEVFKTAGITKRTAGKMYYRGFGIFPGFGFQYLIREIINKSIEALWTLPKLITAPKPASHRGYTFSELKTITDRDLVIVAYNLLLNRQLVLSAATTPSAYVADAIRMSGSFPFVFQPIYTDLATAKAFSSNPAIQRECVGIWMDGGIAANLPISALLRAYPVAGNGTISALTFAPITSVGEKNLTLGRRSKYSENYFSHWLLNRMAEPDQSDMSALSGLTLKVSIVDTIQSVSLGGSSQDLELDTFTFDIEKLFTAKGRGATPDRSAYDDFLTKVAVTSAMF